MFDQSSQVSFAQISFEENDDDARLYESYSFLSKFFSTISISIERDIFFSFIAKFKSKELRLVRYEIISSFSSHSIEFDIAKLFMQKYSKFKFNTADINYNEEFEFNKRSHVDESSQLASFSQLAFSS